MTTRRRAATLAALLTCAAASLPAQETAPPTLDSATSPYREARGLGWDVSDETDPDDPTIPLLLSVGGERLRVDLTVTVAGEPFRRPRGRLTAAVVAGADALRRDRGEAVPMASTTFDGLDQANAARVAEYLRVNEGRVDAAEAWWLLA